MTAPRDWMRARRPAPPADLGERLGTVEGLTGAALVDHLVDEALVALDRARAATGRVRESALDLLVADALLTYACEAALELPDAEGTLTRISQMAAGRR